LAVYHYAEELGRKLAELQSSPNYSPHFLDDEFAMLIKVITSFELEREDDRDDRKSTSKAAQPNYNIPSAQNPPPDEKMIKWKDLILDEKKDQSSAARSHAARKAVSTNPNHSNPNPSNPTYATVQDGASSLASTSPVTSPRPPSSPIHSPRKSPRKSKGMGDWPINVKELL
jgi:hypothetical protein